MRYLTLYTPATSNTDAHTPEHMQATGALVAEMTAAGKLLMTGPLARRESGGFRMRLKGGKYEAAENPEGDSVLLSASGFALLHAGSKEELAADIRHFLEVAGDGTVEVIQIFDTPQPPG